MLYTSTRDSSVRVTSAEAITKGISPDGGLYVPVEIPTVTTDFLVELSKESYTERAKKILSFYLTDFTETEIIDCVNKAYSGGKFEYESVTTLSEIDGKTQILELWRGPTCAFKDMALQLLPHLLTTAAQKTVKGKKIVILVATSGDTGKAALEGFRDVDGTSILVFYPNDGVSPVQKLQMTTQEGENVAVCAIEGNFDDAQNGVKAIFTNAEIEKKLAEKNMLLSSANSINWGRLVPQIVYYISAYCDLISNEKIKVGEKINIAVPTGNFGNILAAYYAMKMGVPIKKLICASNSNNVLTDFFVSGKYNRNRDFYTSISPSMDILISSNLERLLYILSDCDDKSVVDWMHRLSKEGLYCVEEEMLEKMKDIFAAGYCDDTQTKDMISEVYNKYNYLSDTHTAVALKVYKDYKTETGDETVSVIASTASPFKFCKSVLEALNAADGIEDEFEMLKKLSEKTNQECPKQLSGLSEKTNRFFDCCKKVEMAEKVLEMCSL